MPPTNPHLKPGRYKTRCGAVIELIRYNGTHWIGKLNSAQHWHDRWERTGEYAATSERFRAFDILEAVV